MSRTRRRNAFKKLGNLETLKQAVDFLHLNPNLLKKKITKYSTEE